MVWYFGNTTIRNPQRYRQALLTILKHGFSGRLTTKEDQEAYTRALAADGFLDPQKLQRGETDNDAFTPGRKFPRALASLGFLSWELGAGAFPDPQLQGLASKECQVTPAGYLLASAITQEAVQLAMRHAVYHYQVNNLVRQEVTYLYSTFRPVRFLAKIYRELARLQEDVVITDLEFETIVQLSGTNPAAVAAQIQAFRRTMRTNLFVRVDPDDLRAKAAAKLPDYKPGYRVQGGTLRDYADTTIRHLTLSGFFDHYGSTLRPAQGSLDALAAIANEADGCLSPGLYFATLWCGPTA